MTVTLDIRAIEVTTNAIGDAPTLPVLLAQIPQDEQLLSVGGDGAYDTRTCHAAIAERGAEGVPVGLFDALVAQESQYNPLIVSPKGAVGLTQLMPGTAAYLGVFNSRDPLQNLRGGASYLRKHLDEFKRVDLALAAYNAGPGRVRLNGRIPPFRETIGYVSAITRG